jgi:hypothetical protein
MSLLCHRLAVGYILWVVYTDIIDVCHIEDNIKIDLQEVVGGRGDWMDLAQDMDRWRALVGTVRNFRVP